jgi:hypothetical protein
MHESQLLSVELAQRRFDADAAFSEALATFQAALPADSTNPVQAARAANDHGFSWLCRPAGDGLVEVRLRHQKGAEEVALGDSVAQLLAGLLGLPLITDELAPVFPVEQEGQARQPDQLSVVVATPAPAAPASEPAPAPAAEVVAEAAASLAAATGGAVAADADGDQPDPATPLNDTERAAAVEIVKGLSIEQRKVFTIAFRDAFRVPRTEKSIIPTIQQLRHLHFIDRFTVEAAGGISE